VRLETGGHQAATLAQADLVVVSPGVPVEQPAFAAARAKGVEIIGELELAWRWLKGRVIAITGTKGKSTTTTLVGRMLEAAGKHVLVGGNIGVPVSAQVEASTDRSVHVVEVSSFQLATTTTFRPWIAVWLNLTDDHLDRHASMQEYGDAKARIFANQGRPILPWSTPTIGGGDLQRAELRTRCGFARGKSRTATRERRLDRPPDAVGVRALVPVARCSCRGAHARKSWPRPRRHHRRRAPGHRAAVRGFTGSNT
jgi:UDP-N-acetylmuramoylalanine-D-glutamate ligase